MKELGYGKREEGVPREVTRLVARLTNSFFPQNSKESNSLTGTTGIIGTTLLIQNDYHEVWATAGVTLYD